MDTLRIWRWSELRALIHCSSWMQHAGRVVCLKALWPGKSPQDMLTMIGSALDSKDRIADSRGPASLHTKAALASATSGLAPASGKSSAASSCVQVFPLGSSAVCFHLGSTVACSELRAHAEIVFSNLEFKRSLVIFILGSCLWRLAVVSRDQVQNARLFVPCAVSKEYLTFSLRRLRWQDPLGTSRGGSPSGAAVARSPGSPVRKPPEGPIRVLWATCCAKLPQDRPTFETLLAGSFLSGPSAGPIAEQSVSAEEAGEQPPPPSPATEGDVQPDPIVQPLVGVVRDVTAAEIATARGRMKTQGPLQSNIAN